MNQIQFPIGRRGLAASVGALVLFGLVQLTFAESTGPLILDDKPLRYSLQEGDTTLIIRVPKPSLLDQFTFVNENTAVRAALKIAVSNSYLPATDPKWNPVSGEIAFANKRLLNLSMMGVEAKYVKLFFHVEKEARIAAVGF